MSNQPEHDQRAMPQPAPPRTTFAAPRLDLPRFQFRPTATAAPQAQPPQQQVPQAQPMPQAHAQPTPHAHAQPMPIPARSMPMPVHAHAAPAYGHAAPQPTWQATATATALPVEVSTTPAQAPGTAAFAPTQRPALSPAASAMANPTSRVSSISYAPVETTPDRGLLQRITPVHMGVLMVLVVVMMVMTSGPAAMSAKPARLPAAPGVDGGGVNGMPIPARAGAVALDAAGNAAPNAAPAVKGTPATKAAPRAKNAARPRIAKARMLKVGNASVRARVRAGGIPSPAAAANLAVAGGGRVRGNQTGAVRMSGIPSPAAAEQLGPQTLPFRPTDGVTLPRMVGERDSHALDSHYGGATLAMEEPAAPAMTPGGAAAHAERQVTMNQLSGGSTTPPAPVAGGVWAF